MAIDFLFDAFEKYGTKEAVIWDDTSYSYSDLLNATRARIESYSELAGSVVSLDGDYTFETISSLFALLKLGCVVVPLAPEARSQKSELQQIAQVQTDVGTEFVNLENEVTHPLIRQLVDAKTPGLILFSSGTSGQRKAIVHDAGRLLEKYRTPRRAKRTIPFMLFDHIGGVNTMLHVLSSGGTLLGVKNRSPEEVCRTIQAHQVQVLPTTPTFLNLLLLSEVYENYDLSSLEILAYGAEPMLGGRLERLRGVMPNITIMQNYGMSEVGIMRSKSESSDSLWVKIGGDGYETRVRDGLLEIKAQSAMLGYLNAPSPFTEDGWLKTGDMVEVKGEYMKILGRASETVNIGGEKVHPVEVETLLAQMPGVIDVLVSAEKNAITGNIIKATVQLAQPEKRSAFRNRMTEFLKDKVPGERIPQKVVVSSEALSNRSFKKNRGDVS